MSLPNIKKAVFFPMEESPDASRNNSGTSETLELKPQLPEPETKTQTMYTKYRKVGKFYDRKIRQLGNFLTVQNKMIRCFLAELLGTFVFISFGLASVAQYIFVGKISFLSVNVSFGFGLSMGIIISGKISGGHLNPAVSFAFLVQGKLSLLRFLVYTFAQNLGAFLGAVMVYLAYINELHEYSDGMQSFDTAGIFGTYPRNVSDVDGFETFSVIWDQFFASTLFILSILAIADDKNCNLPNDINAVMIGLSLIIIGSSFGINCGFAVNPARDFAPRLFTLIAGWGWKVFSVSNYFSWIPVVMPMLGSVLAVCLYHLFVANHRPKDFDDILPIHDFAHEPEEPEPAPRERRRHTIFF